MHDQLNDADKKKRQIWLYFSWIAYLGLPFFSLIVSYILLINYNYTPEILGPPAAAFALGVVRFLLLYCCAYDKPGTKLLTFALIVSPFGFMKSIAEFIPELRAATDSWPVFGLLLEVAVFAATYYLNFQLLCINKKIRKQAALEEANSEKAPDALVKQA